MESIARDRIKEPAKTGASIVAEIDKIQRDINK